MSISRLLYTCHHLKASECPELTGFIADRIRKIKKALSSQDILAESKCKLCIYDILVKIGEYVMTKNSQSDGSNSIQDSSFKYIHAACTYIIDNSTGDITQTDVASHVGLSPYYFSRLFKQYMHTSFPAYLSNVRTRNAIKLLMDNNLTITEVAFMAGFQSTTAFNKAFRDVKGYSPREYRKMYHERV